MAVTPFFYLVDVFQDSLFASDVAQGIGSFPFLAAPLVDVPNRSLVSSNP